MTSFKSAFVIKGNFGQTPKGRKLRNIMTGLQFFASFTLIIAASFMYLQNRFMQKSPLGYDKDAIITFNIGPIAKQREVFINQMKSFSGIEGVTYADRLLANSAEEYMGWGGYEYKGEKISFDVIPVHHTFFKIMGIKFTEGDDSNWEGVENGLVFNETAKKKYNLELDAPVGSNAEIKGFMPDIKYASFRKAVGPVAFYITKPGNYNLNQMYIRVKAGADMRAAMKHVQTTIAELAPTNPYPTEVLFFDEVLQRLYEKETAQNLLITLFSLIAIFISIAGVFGLVVFDNEYRRKEVGIRKIHGASTFGILLMFNKAYFKILAICMAIAAPVAWYAIDRWLETFAYKTPMYWWVYLLVFIAVSLITAATITFQNWRVAVDNPVNAIKME
jgi:putative ABC transport system permease protein